MKISIIGDGGWGTTIALLLYKKGYNITQWGVFPDYVKFLQRKRENPRFLPGIKIPKKIRLTSNMDEAIEDARLVVLAAPSQHMRVVLKEIRACRPKAQTGFISVSKGIENKSLMRMSEVVHQVLGPVQLAVLSGPTISYEVVRRMPTTVVAASHNKDFSKLVQKVFFTDRFRVYTSEDVAGVELGGSLKNVIAISAGMVDGMGFEANTKAGLLARGLAEITRLGMKMGARQHTFYGISGLGDLVTTCISEHGRNRWFGEQIGRGKKAKIVLKKTDMVVEGFATSKSAYELSKKHKVEMPIVRQVHSVLHKNKNPKKAMHELMTRKPKAE